MGTQNSKINDNKNNISISDMHLPSTPKPKIIDCDPRSPSANIARTPIQSAVDLNQADTPIIGVIQSEDDDQQDKVTLDPRSPTVEFTRTPIVLGNEFTKPRNKKLDLVRQHLSNFSPMKPHGTEINPIRSKGPIFLGVSPVTKKLNQEKRKSYIGLLETDLDFTETDLDEVTKPKQNQIKEEIEQEENVNDEEPKEKIIKTDSGILQEPKEELNDTHSSDEKEQIIDSIEREVIKKMTDREILISPIKESLEKIKQIDKEIKEVIATAHNSNVIDIDEENLSNAFDKKVTNLIYEDHEIINIPKNIKQQNNGGNRTPLGVRNLNQSDKKSKLRVHDKPTMNKNDYVVSKIPVFKEKKSKSKITQALQCENTPPRQMTDTKHKKSQWDSDKTLII